MMLHHHLELNFCYQNLLCLIVFTIKNAIEYKKALKQPIVKEEIKPTNEELILDELKKINANLQAQNAQKNSNK